MVRRVNRIGRSQAARADRHALYELAVQNVDELCRFIDLQFLLLRGRRPLGFCEDFCGTAQAACQFLRLGRRRRAIGIDIDQRVLDWARRHHLAALGRRQRQRIRLIRGDVRRVAVEPVDVVGAFNFSYWVFRKRGEMLDYFRCVYDRLTPDGVFFLDAYGGHDAFRALEEEQEQDDFTYVWEQADYNPLTGHMRTHIHFRFADGSELRRAFSYRWRLWTIPELREMLAEAGFSEVQIFREETGADGDGLGCWRPVHRLGPVPAFIVNIAAAK